MHRASTPVPRLDLGADRSSVQLDGRRVRVTKVFWRYWYLAAERQAMFMRRLRGESAPWTEDPILQSHRFTNAYRASDRVSQSLLQGVIYSGAHECRDTVLRVVLFKVFNHTDTWRYLVSEVGEPTVATFDRAAYTTALDHRFDSGSRLYSGAYIMPSPALGQRRKHANHLALLEQIIADGTIDAITQARSLRDLYQELLQIPSFGSFLAYQYAIDLNYSPHFPFDEMEFVVAGPGALRGIEKCFTDTRGLDPVGVIRAMTNAAEIYLTDSSADFEDLWGRPLHLIDCQNLFCEVDKYARAAHPEISVGGPKRIKQAFRPDEQALRLGYPPKWRLPWSADAPVDFGTHSDGRELLSYFPTNTGYSVAMNYKADAVTVPSAEAPPAEHLQRVRDLVLSELPGLRLDRSRIEAALDSGDEERIPSRKAMVIIARVCKILHVGKVVKQSDLKPDQVTDVANLIELLASKTAPALVRA